MAETTDPGPDPGQEAGPEPGNEDAGHDSATLIVHSASAASFSGPLPPPAIMRGYEDIQPGFADRIMTMAENESLHRQRMERTSLEVASDALQEDLKRARLGLYLAASVAVFFLAASAAIAAFVDTIAGSVLSGVDIAILASVFVYGVRQRPAESDVEAELSTLAKRHEEM